MRIDLTLKETSRALANTHTFPQNKIWGTRFSEKEYVARTFFACFHE